MPAQCAAIQRADRGRDRRTPVAALRAVARIAEAIHQHRPGLTRCDRRPSPSSVGLSREAEAGQRRTDDVKRVGGVAAVRGRIGQRLDHLVELDDRTRPAMGDDQRHRFRVRRADVQEMNVEPVDLGGELRKAIEPRLAPAPVVLLGPVAADVLDPLQRRALAPVVDQFGFGPARVAQPRLQVVEHVVADGNAEWLHGIVHARHTRHDPEKCEAVFPRDKRVAFARRSCPNKSRQALPSNQAGSSRRRSQRAKDWRFCRGSPQQIHRSGGDKPGAEPIAYRAPIHTCGKTTGGQRQPAQ